MGTFERSVCVSFTVCNRLPCLVNFSPEHGTYFATSVMGEFTLKQRYGIVEIVFKRSASVTDAYDLSEHCDALSVGTTCLTLVTL